MKMLIGVSTVCLSYDAGRATSASLMCRLFRVVLFHPFRLSESLTIGMASLGHPETLNKLRGIVVDFASALYMDPFSAANIILHNFQVICPQ